MQDLALGIDIGGTNTVFGLVNRRGEIIRQGSLSTKGHASAAAFVAILAEQLRPWMAEMGPERIAGVGVGAPNGNFYTGEIVYAPNLEWGDNVPLAHLVTTALGTKTVITNDANAATLGEMMYGAARGMKDFIMITLGTGVGSGFVANGQLIYGHDGFAGELGHVIAVREGRECGCGRKGCLETYASATGIVRTAKEWLEQSGQPSVLRNVPDLDAQRIGAAAAAGDALALQIFDFTGKVLGQCLADAVAITSPEAIILFGGLARAGELILAPTGRYMEEAMLRIYRGKVKLLLSALPDGDAAILGASALVW